MRYVKRLGLLVALVAVFAAGTINKWRRGEAWEWGLYWSIRRRIRHE